MKKLKKIIVIIIVLGFILLISAYLLLGVIVKAGAENILPGMTKTDVVLGDFDLSLLSGELVIDNLKIGNPEGFSEKSAFELKKVHITFVTTSLLSKEVHIKTVLIDGIKLNYELGPNGKTNFDVIQNNIDGDKTETEEEVVTEEKVNENLTVIIDILDIKNSEVSTNLVTLPLPDIHKEDIGKNGDSDITKTFKDLFSLLTSGVNGVLGVGGKVLNTLGNGADSVQEGTSSVIKSIKGLF